VNVGLEKNMKYILLLLFILGSSSCAPRRDAPSVLDLRVSDPFKAMRVQAASSTPEETIGEKLASFTSTVIREHPQVGRLPVYVEPTVACVRIAGWKNEDIISIVAALDMTVRESLVLFCDIVYCCRLTETDGVILIKADSSPLPTLLTIYGNDSSDPFSGTSPFDD
jgi:hypothetical protein